MPPAWGAPTVALIESADGAANFIHTDVSDAGAVLHVFDEIAETVGPYDVLFNHAGTPIVKPLHASTEEDHDRLMDINVKSAFLVCKRAVKAMAAEQDRICEPEEVSAAVLFLASDEACFINGTALHVDNGWYAKG